MISRRTFLAATAALATPGRSAAANSDLAARLAEPLASIEQRSGGRLGVAVLDTASGARAGHRADERFPMCSTFKMLAAAAVLQKVERGEERLDRRVRYAQKDIVIYSPITEKHVADGMTMEELCEAAMVVSDNTAGNLLLNALGGPGGITAYARSLGDGITRLDRIEPALNEALPGDVRDTTSPAAMLGNLRALVLGNALAPASREKLTGWLIGNKTGDTRLRAGLPGWTVGDKTGAGERGTNNVVGIAWPPGGRAPVLIAIYLTGTAADAPARNATLAAVGKAVAGALA